MSVNLHVNEEVIELVTQRRKINIEEVREIFSNRNYRRGFSLFDEDKNGFIDIQELKQMINELNRDKKISPDMVKKVMNIADNNNDGRLDYNEFVKMFENPQFHVLFGKYLNLYVKNVIPRPPVILARSFGVDEKDGQFEEQYKCCPPPILMIIISIIEIIFYSYDMIMHDATQGTGPIATVLMYNPHKRYEAWRYITYMLVHIGPTHLCMNLIVQILLGIPFEMVHGWRIIIIYLWGVIAGSLITSILDPTVYLAGASGGVYALITAHIASIIMNWEHMSTAIIQLVIFLVITIADFGTAIYNRFFLNVKDNIGFEAHVGGAIAGLLVGTFVVRNLEFNKCETKLWWVALITFCVLITTAIVWNIAWPSYFPQAI